MRFATRRSVSGGPLEMVITGCSPSVSIDGLAPVECGEMRHDAHGDALLLAERDDRPDSGSEPSSGKPEEDLVDRTRLEQSPRARSVVVVVVACAIGGRAVADAPLPFHVPGQEARRGRSVPDHGTAPFTCVE
jgi:hypothetical protein